MLQLWIVAVLSKEKPLVSDTVTWQKHFTHIKRGLFTRIQRVDVEAATMSDGNGQAAT